MKMLISPAGDVCMKSRCYRHEALQIRHRSLRSFTHDIGALQQLEQGAVTATQQDEQRQQADATVLRCSLRGERRADHAF